MRVQRLSAHEAPLEVLRQRPNALLELLRVAGSASSHESQLTVELLDSELTEAIPSVRQADLVTILRDDTGRITRSVIVEVQRDRDEDKVFVWPLYMAYLLARHRVPVTLLVVTFNASVATWARTHRTLGSHFVSAPLVIGPDDLPEIASLAEACAHPDLSLFTALVRNGERDSPRDDQHDEEVARICEATLRIEDTHLRKVYLSLLHGTSRGELRAKLTKLMEEHGMGALELIRAEGVAEGEALGEARGEAMALLKVLRARGLHVDEVAEARIRGTHDISLIDRWLERAATATELHHVLSD